MLCEQTGEVSAEAAAGLYLEDRTAQLQALHLLLQAQACCEALPEDPASKALGQFNSLLLKCPPGAKSGALHALLDAAKVGFRGQLNTDQSCGRCSAHP